MAEENGALTAGAATNPLTDVVHEAEEQFLIFRSGGILYAINTNYVNEILTNTSITQVPMTPEYIGGVINLRGQIVPIVDFRLLLGRFSEDSGCVIILNIEGTEIGILVDSVDQMTNLSRSTILPVPSQRDQRLVNGMCTVPGIPYTVMVIDAVALIHVHE